MISLLLSATGLLALFTATWIVSRRINNYSIVDGVWALSFAPVAAFYAWMGDGLPLRKWLIAALVAAWSLRLGIYLTRRIAGHHPEEDRRYAILRSKWSAKGFLFFFWAQALLTWLLMLPVFLIAQSPLESLSPLELAGSALWIIALLGEGVSDAQLSRFLKSDQRSPNAVCQEGLWRYSRHPNYFFQSLIWWALFLIALPAPNGSWAILAPLAMLTALLRFTGIPLTERLSVEKRGDAYRSYQETTSAFLPLPPKPTPPSP